VARLLEEAGIATVIIAIRAFRDRLEAMTPARLLLTPHLLGQPLGSPNNVERHRAVVLSALGLLEGAERAGTIVNWPS
jgi:hypothetical protein